MLFTKLSLGGNNYSRPGRVWYVTFRLGMGMSLTFFTVYLRILFMHRLEFSCFADFFIRMFKTREGWNSMEQKTRCPRIPFLVCYGWCCLYWPTIVGREDACLSSSNNNSVGMTHAARAGIFKQSMGVRNRIGIELSYQPARLHRLAEFIPRNRFMGSINV